MKQFFAKAAILIATGGVLLASCNKGDDDGSVPFTSELIGSYTPVLTSEPDSAVPSGDMFVNTEWPDPDNVPMIDMSFMAGEGAVWPASLVPLMMSGIYTGLYGGGLVSFDFNNDGTFGCKYRKLINLENLEFTPEVFTFPDAETQKLIPDGALTYYTQDGKVYFSVSKAYLTQIGNAQLGMDLVPVIDDMIDLYNLQSSIVSTEESYSLPLKYTRKDGTLTIIIDREMLLPFMPILEMLVSTMVPESVTVDGFDAPIPARELLSSLLDALITKSSKFDIGVNMNYK